MRVLRSSLVAATAIIAAACGDKVTVPASVTTPAKIESVVVAPATATISVGQSVQLSAAVSVDAGVTATVAWTTSSAAAASVTQTGLVAGVAASPGVAICATATQSTQSVENCATVVVQAAGVITPATVQIASVTGANLNAPVPVPPGTVAGQINVSVNVNPGTEKIDSVVVFVNGISAGTQTFTSAQAAALRSAANDAIAAQALLPTLVFSINTAAYNTTTGVPTYLNGPMVISAVAYGHLAGAAATNSASQNLSYILGNADGFQVTVVNNGHTAIDANGYAWWGNGTVTLNALPVMYSGKTVGTVTGSLGVGALGGTCILPVPAPAVSTTTPVAGVWSVVLPLAGVQSPAGCTTTTPNLPNIVAIDAGGNVLPLGGTVVFGGLTNGILNAQTGVRFDNVAPPTAGLIAALAVNGRTGNWINDAVSLNTVNNAVTNPNGAIAAGVIDAGVGAAGGAGTGITYTTKVGTTFTIAKTAAGLTNTSSLAMLATNASYCGIVYTADALGNTSGSPTGTCAVPTANATYVLPVAGIGSVQFGVDRIAPLISYSGGLAANALSATATLGGEFSVIVSDTGLVGNSGMAPASPVIMQVSQRAAAGNGPGTTTCLNANNTAATTCGVLSAVGVNAAGIPIYTTSMTALTANAYLTFTATATDAAGNTTTIAPRIVAHDAGPLVVGNASTPITVAANGYTASAFINDGLDIASYWFSGDFATLNGNGGFATGPSATPVRFMQAATAVDGFNAPSFLNTNYAVTGTVTLPLDLQLAGVLYPMSNINANATNVVATLATGASVATPTVAPALAVFAPAGLATFPAVTNSIASNNISSGVTTAPTAGNPASGTLTATSTGPTATYNNPFSRVDFYAVNNGGAAGTQWVLIGSTSVQTLVDNGIVRTYSWTLAISGATLYTQLGFVATAATNVIAIGYNASGSIGMINTAFYSLTIIK